MMKIMKKEVWYIYLFLLACCFSACDGGLVGPGDKISPQVVVKEVDRWHTDTVYIVNNQHDTTIVIVTDTVYKTEINNIPCPMQIDIWEDRYIRATHTQWVGMDISWDCLPDVVEDMKHSITPLKGRPIILYEYPRTDWSAFATGVVAGDIGPSDIITIAYEISNICPGDEIKIVLELADGTPLYQRLLKIQ